MTFWALRLRRECKRVNKMKRPNNKIIILLGIVVLLAIVAVIVSLKSCQVSRAVSEEKETEGDSVPETLTPEITEEATPEPTETPTPTEAAPMSPEEQKELLIEGCINYILGEESDMLSGILKYKAEDGSAVSFPQEEVEQVLASVNGSDESFSMFIAYLQSEDVSVEEGADGCYLVIPGSSLTEVISLTQSNGIRIAIDPGHQAQGNSEQEAIGPGASQTKPKVASGTTGRTTGVPEYQLNLDVSLKLRDELVARGYDVYMIRETNDVNISNSERAKLAADAGADILVRIHANGSDNTSVAGALTMSPSMNNPYVPGDLVAECQELSQCVIEAFCEATGANNQGVYQTDEMSGLNWCTIPATIVEMGYMTNPEEDTLMQTEDYQNKMVQGISNGIDRYFGRE